MSGSFDNYNFGWTDKDMSNSFWAGVTIGTLFGGVLVTIAVYFILMFVG
jgi:hypothetical protein